MPEFAPRSSCTGCGACAAACSVNALSLVEDVDGFSFPSVDMGLCVGCGKCTAVCPVLNPIDHCAEVGYPRFLAGQLEDKGGLGEVSSGGASWALMQATLMKGGIVYGACQETAMTVRHCKADSLPVAASFRRSKYIPSEAWPVFSDVRANLDAGCFVLFTGTPCQVAGLLGLLGGGRPNLVTCEVVCHGIPTPKAWRSFVSEKEESVGRRIVAVNFRDKSTGWRKVHYRIVYDDSSEEVEYIGRNVFHASYLRGLLSRTSCGTCRYARIPRIADITLADFWKYDGTKFAATAEDGVSLVVVNSEKGERLVAASRVFLDTEPTSEATVVASCRHLRLPPKESAQRRAFLDELAAKGCHAAARRFLGPTTKPSVARRLVQGISKFFRLAAARDARRTVALSFRDMMTTPVFPELPHGFLRLVFGRPAKGKVVVSDFGMFRRIARRRGFKSLSMAKALSDSERLLALGDTFELLRRKGVAVWFCNRVGKCKEAEWHYGLSAERRMEQGLSFPTMYAEPEKYADDLKELLGKKYSPEYIRDIGRIPQIVVIDGIARHEDCSGPCVNVSGGLRVTVGQPVHAVRTLHVYGRCGAFGYAVDDADTLPSRIQAELSARGVVDMAVVNHGLWGGDDETIDGNFIREAAGFRRGDVVLFYRKHLAPALHENWARKGVRYLDITKAWHEAPAARHCFYDRPGHMNAEGYVVAARLIADALVADIRKPADTPETTDDSALPWLARYLKKLPKGNLDARFADFAAKVLHGLPPLGGGETAGAIVMNCNPFTNGHRLLVERAAREVNRLFILVVEEDRSFFRFKDRLEMVRSGVADLKNVVVAPSGRFVISSLTFPEYFMKDYVKERDFDVSSDVRTFAEQIAPRLGVTVRFAGEEPFDPVTANYNKCMAELLPKYGITFREIPRFSGADGRPISATEVRRLLAAGDWKALAATVPETTLAVLKERYAPEGAMT